MQNALKKLLPLELFESIKKHLNYDKLQEIRLRANCPIIIKYSNKYYYFSTRGIVNNQSDAYFVSPKFLESVVLVASNNSLYSINDQLKNGYITYCNGIRIGVAGEVVYEKNEVKTIKHYQALNIRIAHQIYDCSKQIIDYLLCNDEFKNTLILSVPGGGKTTFIRDIVFQLYKKQCSKNILVIDERGEICASNESGLSFEMGDFCDCLTHCSKQYGFEKGIRVFSPDIMVTDEISNENDVNSLINISNCGVKLLATTHCKNIDELQSKVMFEQIIKHKIFERFVVLSNQSFVGTIQGVFDQNFNTIWEAK